SDLLLVLLFTIFILAEITTMDERDYLPDVRDGLTRIERIILTSLNELEKQRDGRMVPTAMLYGRVVEQIDISVDDLQSILQKFNRG
ncbi:MAG: hypothetical protein MI864_28355, partial [Pseudomonadales bacterium]|nr:hypothetical protein [Pseudomonadales bacterium]